MCSLVSCSVRFGKVQYVHGPFEAKYVKRWHPQLTVSETLLTRMSATDGMDEPGETTQDGVWFGRYPDVTSWFLAGPSKSHNLVRHNVT